MKLNEHINIKHALEKIEKRFLTRVEQIAKVVGPLTSSTK